MRDNNNNERSVKLVSNKQWATMACSYGVAVAIIIGNKIVGTENCIKVCEWSKHY